MNPEISATRRPLDEWAKSTTLDRIADAIQPPLQRSLEGDDAPRPLIRDVLHGTFLGHALHPLLTDVPVGAWTVTAMCDLLEIAGGPRYREAADVALVIGAAGAVAAAITGLADWSDTKDDPKRLGILHASLNGASLASYLLSLAARRAGSRGFGIAAGLSGYALLTAAAYIGGELSLGLQLGVKHTAVPIDPGADFVSIVDDAAVGEGEMKPADAAGIPLLVTRRDGEVCAVSGVCTHRGAPLADGTRSGDCVRCPWHGSRFSLDDGRVLEGPATFGLALFETKVADGMISARPIQP